MSHSIKFTHGPDGKIPNNITSTALADLFTIGAVSLTSKCDVKGDLPIREYATDRKGLKDVSLKAEEALSFLSRSTHTLGVLLAHSDHKELEEQMVSIAWMIAGFGELAELLIETKASIDDSLANDKQA